MSSPKTADTTNIVNGIHDYAAWCGATGVVRCSGCGPLTLALEVGDSDIELDLHVLLPRGLVHKQLTHPAATDSTETVCTSECVLLE